VYRFESISKKQEEFFTKIEFSHPDNYRDTKAQKKNAKHFFYFVPLRLRGNLFS